MERFGKSTVNDYVKVKLESKNLIVEKGSIGFNNAVVEALHLNSEEEAAQAFTSYCERLRETHHELNIDFENSANLSFIQPNSQLDASVAVFLNRILDNYMILGIPNVQELNGAREVLRQIGESINSRPMRERSDIIDENHHLHEFIFNQSNEFYQMIPHVGPGYFSDIRRGFRPPIETEHIWRAKTEVLQRLETVLNIIESGIQAEGVHPLDYLCDNLLQTRITPIPTNEYGSFIKDFDISSKDSALIKGVFKVHKDTWDANFRNDIKKHHYLFHTAHMSKMMDILRDGLKVAPSHVVSLNRWLGKGIYFFGNSKAIFSYAGKLKCDVVLVCRVAMGETEIMKRNYDYRPPNYMHELDDGKHSIRSLGRGYESTFDWNDEKNAYLPTGVDSTGEKGSHYDEHDEFLVQNEDQVKIEYIIELNDQAKNQTI